MMQNRKETGPFVPDTVALAGIGICIYPFEAGRPLKRLSWTN